MKGLSRILDTCHIKRIRHAVVLPLLAMFLLTVALMNVLIYQDSQRMVRSVLSELRGTVQALVANELQARIDQAALLAGMNRAAYLAGYLDLSDPTSRERYFSSALRQFDGVSMAYVGLPDGSFYGSRRYMDGVLENVRNNADTNGASVYHATDAEGDSTDIVQVVENFDPRTRPWYKAAATRGDIALGSIYSHFVLKEPTLTASIPVFEGDRLVAVFGVDYLMTWLGVTLRSLPVGPNGQVFILDAQGRLVATTTEESIFRMMDGKSQNILATDSADPITKSVAERALLGKPMEDVWKSADGNVYLVGLDTFSYEDLSWTLCTVIREDDFLGSFHQNQTRTVMVVSLISSLFVLLALRSGRHIARPIQILNEGMKQLQNGAFGAIIYRGHLIEMRELTEGFNEMSRALTRQVDDLEAEVRRRTGELEEKNGQLFQMARMDELMRIPNRRRFDEFFAQAYALSIRNGRPIGLMMLDIDFFKSYNDTYGHLAGDECLKRIGVALSGLVHRKTDLVARFGGEEMVVVVQETSAEGFQAMAEHIRSGVEALGIPHASSHHGVVTASVGAVHGPVGEEMAMEGFLRLADEALYEAKQSGRNRVSFRFL